MTVRRTRTPASCLHDAIMSAAARDKTADETGDWRDNLKAMLAIARVGWRLRRAEKDRDWHRED